MVVSDLAPSVLANGVRRDFDELPADAATMTLDHYGHLFPDGLDEPADRFDDAASALMCP